MPIYKEMTTEQSRRHLYLLCTPYLVGALAFAACRETLTMWSAGAFALYVIGTVGCVFSLLMLAKQIFLDAAAEPRLERRMALGSSMLAGCYIFFRLPEHLPAILPAWAVHLYIGFLVIALGAFLRWMHRRSPKIPLARLIK